MALPPLAPLLALADAEGRGVRVGVRVARAVCEALREGSTGEELARALEDREGRAFVSEAAAEAVAEAVAQAEVESLAGAEGAPDAVARAWVELGAAGVPVPAPPMTLLEGAGALPDPALVREAASERE